MGKDYCWFDVCIGGTPQKERIVMELFDDVVPQTCRNFRQLCLGNNGEMVTRTNGSQTPMTYKNSIFHRVIKGFMIQGGDFTKRDGTGGVSIYGEKFEDENFELPCDKSGLLAMANAGRNTNGSQFFITVAPASHLTGKHVVFGRVVRGMNTVRNIEHVSTGVADRPTNECCVVDCGTVDTLEDVVPPADGDVYPEYACDAQPSLNDKGLMEAAEKIRQIGSSHFQSGSFEIAAEKYVKAASYLAEVKESLVDEKVLNEQKVACNNNAAMCYLKLQQWSAAHKSATKALKYDPNNTKALFRRATAFLHLNDATGAVADLREAQRLEPQNADVAAKLNEAKAMERAQKEKMASRFKTMFS